MIDPKKYPAEVFFSEEDEGYIALARDLPGCSAFGETQKEALAELHDAIEAWQIAAETAGNPIPAPSKPTVDPLPNGKILLRTPRSLHAALIEAAKRESVSLNQHLVSALSANAASNALVAQFSARLSDIQTKIHAISNAGATVVFGAGYFQQCYFVGQTGPRQPTVLNIEHTQIGKTAEVFDASEFRIFALSDQAKEHEHG